MTPPRRPNVVRWVAGAALVAAIGAGGLYLRQRMAEPAGTAAEPLIAPPPQVAPTLAQRWRAAANLVEEDRGVPMGGAARPAIPAELRHYANRRRFLAVQVAGWMQHEFELPHDDAALARLIGAGELVEIEPVSEHHVLYGVGANASDGPFVHWDPRTARSVRLFPDWGAFDDARAELRAEIVAQQEAVNTAQAAARKLTARQRTRRNALNAEIRVARAKIAAAQSTIALESSYYDDYDKRRAMVEEWQALADRARAFPDRVYDLRIPRDRRALRGRMLSFVRPTAREVMAETAAAYHAEFGRPLAFTSLYRTLHYQRQLGRVNPNATAIEVPPHSTGLAYDIYYRYMTKEEQEFVMALIAAQERDGRVEALHELRNHFHVFAFADGTRPPERLIVQALHDIGPGPTARRATRSGSTARSAANRPPARTRRAAARNR